MFKNYLIMEPAFITIIGMFVTTGAFLLVALLLRRQAKNDARESAKKTIWPAVNCAYSPSAHLVPDERERKNIKTLNRWLVLGVPEASSLSREALTCLLEGAAMRMDRPFLPAACGGTEVAARNIAKFKKQALGTVPEDLQGRIEFMDSGQLIPDEQQGTFTRLTHLVGEAKKRDGKRRDKLIGHMDEMHLDADEQRILLKAAGLA